RGKVVRDGMGRMERSACTHLISKSQDGGVSQPDPRRDLMQSPLGKATRAYSVLIGDFQIRRASEFLLSSDWIAGRGRTSGAEVGVEVLHHDATGLLQAGVVRLPESGSEPSLLSSGDDRKRWT